MKFYNEKDIEIALKKVGLKKNQIIYINPEIYKFGILKEAQNKNDYFRIFFNKINKIIGKNGTIAINSYTFQTLRHKKKFVYEKTISSSGMFSEFVRNKKGSLRSHHPVFSVVSYGKFKNKICGNNSLSNYGFNSPYDNFLKLNGQILNLGMNPAKNPFIHVSEFLAAVPYCYNKLTKVSYFKKNKKMLKYFSSFVRYKNLKIKRNHNKLLKKMLSSNFIKKASLGSGFIYMFDSKKYVDLVLKLLSKDQFFLFNKKLNFKKGFLPYD